MKSKSAALTARARAMRRLPTDAERRVWYGLRDRRLARWKFRRQVPAGPFIADFLCYEARLIVEVDGAQHGGSAKDIARTSYLERRGYRVVRFWNHEVLREYEAVMEAIFPALEPG